MGKIHGFDFEDDNNVMIIFTDGRIGFTLENKNLKAFKDYLGNQEIDSIFIGNSLWISKKKIVYVIFKDDKE